MIGRDPHLGLPRGEGGRRRRAGAQIEQLLRAFRIPELVLPGPLHAHWTAERLREQQRVGSGVVGAVHAVEPEPSTKITRIDSTGSANTRARVARKP